MTAWTLVLLSTTPSMGQEPLLFEDDFEGGLDKWVFPKGAGARLISTGDSDHGTVLSLQTVDRIVVAIMEGSNAWDDVRIEGEMLFPEDVHNYLGFVYRYQEGGGRTDFGSLYVKGNGSYIRANPHYDMNVGRTLYEEFRTTLTGPAEVRIGRWTAFALEVVGAEAHLYVGDRTRPQVTFPHFDRDRGGFGFKPRNPGGAVYVDNVSARRIGGFTYRGPRLPNLTYPHPPMEIRWDVLGPLTRFVPDVETSPFNAALTIVDRNESLAWQPFQADERGAVVTATVVDYEGPRRVAYFHGAVSSDRAQTVTLSLSTVDDLSIWVNGAFLGFVDRESTAWWDAWSNDDHASDVGTIPLEEGVNHLILRVVGGIYAAGGFFLRLVPEGPPL